MSSPLPASSLDDDRRVRLERVLALARLGLALTGMALLRADRGPLGGGDASLAATLLSAYTAFALGAAILVALFSAFIGPLSVVLHVLDVLWVVGITPLPEQPVTVLFVVAAFAVVGAAFRWGQRTTVATGLVIAALLVGGGLVLPVGAFSAATLGRLTMLGAYVAGTAYLIGALAEEQHQARRQSAAVARILSAVNLASGLRASMTPLLGELSTEFGTSRAALAVKEVGSGRVYVWDLASRAAEATVSELDEDRRGIWYVALPGGSAIVRLVERRGGRIRIRYGDRVRRAEAPVAQALDVLLGGARRALVGDWQISREWTGRLVLHDPGKAADDRGRRWLASLLPQVGPALYSLYLLGRLRSRATAMERARVARELHDGVIQSLVGLEMHVETLRRELEKAGSPAASALQDIRETLRASALNTRDLMQQLKPVDMGVGDLPGQLATAADRFRRDTGINTDFVCDLHDVQIVPRVGREILRIAQEALVNVRKHSQARQVLLRFGAKGDRWQLTIDDDGRGFEFNGRYSLDQLDAERRGPLVIKERVRGIGGTLTLDSTPGRGTRLEISVPQRGR